MEADECTLAGCGGFWIQMQIQILLKLNSKSRLRLAKVLSSTRGEMNLDQKLNQQLEAETEKPRASTDSEADTTPYRD